MLAFVARRLESEPILLVAALRDGSQSPLEVAGLPELVLDRLDDDAATALLEARCPTLTPEARARGCSGRRRATRWPSSNCPIAMETAAAAAGTASADDARLEQTFTARMSGLPPATPDPAAGGRGQRRARAVRERWTPPR